MFYVVAALFFGFMIPYLARRFAKFMPATFAGALVEIFRREKKLKRYRKTELYRKIVWRSVVSAIFCGGITMVAYWHFGSFGFGFLAAFFWILLLLAEIDFKTMLLPDILTVPLILLGFWAASSDMGFVSVDESALGAVVGYFLPAMVSLLIVWRKKDAFGGGDIKLLAAVGAWLGVEKLLYVVLAASVLGIVYGLMRKVKVMPFGPMIALSAIVVALCLF